MATTFILKLIGWVALLFLGISFIPTVIDVFVKYKKFDRDGTFRDAKRGKHHLDKKTYIRKAAIILTIQFILVVVLYYLLVIKY